MTTPEEIIATLAEPARDDVEMLQRVRAAVQAIQDLVLQAANERYPGIETCFARLLAREAALLKRVGEA